MAVYPEGVYRGAHDCVAFSLFSNDVTQGLWVDDKRVDVSAVFEWTSGALAGAVSVFGVFLLQKNSFERRLQSYRGPFVAGARHGVGILTNAGMKNNF